MSSIQEQYQADILSLRSELTKLESKRNDLLLKLLEYRPVVHEYTSAKAPQDLKPIESEWNIEKLYRLSGITFFVPSDPEKYVPLKKKPFHKLVGARIDLFHQGVFLKPHYLIFRLDNGLSLYKHTIPNFIDIDLLAKKWLNKETNTFLCLIRRQLLYHAIRSAHIRELENIFSNSTILCDPAAAFMEIKNKKYTIIIKFGNTNIEKTMIKNSKGERIVELEKKLIKKGPSIIHHLLE
ncbi:uncharacterized protein T551_00747 [Pneumocystis jirovecii RU7]|uniref:Cenp-O kinetochore centromere component n=1 Tax=Pneumocystis jirovecii (strain RU7) TaxID=1408657 RepID=A0A0W4ZUK5_PNEJ7|nr:uncharacterized protein T551_00747 [Pneumocystis jirovecii RU7]KTW32065.1 hypothetical protein T551_00747 [Pneumocystis jirovecii RU7]